MFQLLLPLQPTAAISSHAPSATVSVAMHVLDLCMFHVMTMHTVCGLKAKARLISTALSVMPSCTLCHHKSANVRLMSDVDVCIM